MGKVTFHNAVSLDGFVAGPNDRAHTEDIISRLESRRTLGVDRL